MQYYEQDERRSRMWGLIALAVYLAVCVGIMFVTYTISLPEPELGILVDFGTSDTGMGEDDLAMGEMDTTPYVPPQPDPSSESVMTSEDPEAPAIVAEEQSEERPDAPQTPPTPTPEPVPVREPDRRALFPGRTEGSNATSQGTAGGEGNQGTQEGSPGGSDSAGGMGVEGYALGNRHGVGIWPSPKYTGDNLSGRVVIDVVVNAQGIVTSATYQPKTSTTNNGILVNAAREAALKARFTESERQAQQGTITYNFKLN